MARKPLRAFVHNRTCGRIHSPDPSTRLQSGVRRPAWMSFRVGRENRSQGRLFDARRRMRAKAVPDHLSPSPDRLRRWRWGRTCRAACAPGSHGQWNHPSPFLGRVVFTVFMYSPALIEKPRKKTQLRKQVNTLNTREFILLFSLFSSTSACGKVYSPPTEYNLIQALVR